MDQDQAEVISTAALKEFVGKLASGQVPATLPEELSGIDELEDLRLYMKEMGRFALDISSGNLSTNIKLKGALAGALKSLHAGLRHLIWQTQAISKGDFTQRIDFMGDFSDAFNSMVADLQRAREELVNANDELHVKNEELSKYSAMRDKMFSIIAHDLRNPIGSAVALMNMMTDEQMGMEDSEKIASIPLLRDSFQSSYELLENLLLWARNQLGSMTCSPEMIGVSGIAERVCLLLSGMATGKSIELITEIEPGLTVYADKNMFDTMVRNLVSNALKFTSAGGKIHITGCQCEDNTATLCVRDNGVGISPENMMRIFRQDEESFTTYGTKNEKGTGLGLNLCHEFVERNGGRIWVESEVGVGSAFYFTLPVTRS